jgi:hypothetical protein
VVEVAPATTRFSALCAAYRDAVKSLLELRVITPAHISACFVRERDEQTLTSFLEKYWEWPFKQWGKELVTVDEYARMVELYTEYLAAASDYRQRKDRALARHAASFRRQSFTSTDECN